MVTDPSLVQTAHGGTYAVRLGACAPWAPRSRAAERASTAVLFSIDTASIDSLIPSPRHLGSFAASLRAGHRRRSERVQGARRLPSVAHRARCARTRWRRYAHRPRGPLVRSALHRVARGRAPEATTSTTRAQGRRRSLAGRLVALGSPTSSLSSAAPATGGVGQQLSAPSSPAAAPAASTPVDRLYSNGLFNPPADLQDDAPSTHPRKPRSLLRRPRLIRKAHKATRNASEPRSHRLFAGSSPYANPATGQFVSKRPRRGAPLASPSKPSGELRKSALSPFRVRPRADSIAAGEEPDATPEPQPCCDALVEGLTAPPKDADRVYAYRHGSHGGDQPLQISEESCINPMALIAGEDWERFARHERPAASMSRFTGSAVSGSRRGSHSGGGTASSVRAAPARLRQPSDPGSYHAGSLISVSDAYLGARSQGQAPSCTGPLAASPASATPAKRSAAENGAFRALMTSPDASTAQEVARMIWGSGRKTASARPRSPARAIAAAPDECVSRPAHQLALARAGPDGGGQVGAGASSDGGSGVPAAWQPQAPSGLSGASCGRVTVADKDARVQRRLSGAHSATEPAAAASRQASESAEASQQPGDAAQGAATSPTAASISTMSGTSFTSPSAVLAAACCRWVCTVQLLRPIDTPSPLAVFPQPLAL